MYPELGQLALILSLLLAVLLSVVPLAGALTGRDSLQAFARPLASGMFVFTALAFAILTHAFLVDDFSVAYVANNSNSMLPQVWNSASCPERPMVRTTRSSRLMERARMG